MVNESNALIIQSWLLSELYLVKSVVKNNYGKSKVDIAYACTICSYYLYCIVLSCIFREFNNFNSSVAWLLSGSMGNICNVEKQIKYYSCSQGRIQFNQWRSLPPHSASYVFSPAVIFNTSYTVPLFKFRNTYIWNISGKPGIEAFI